MSDWIGLPDNLNMDDHFAIVYRITNNITNKKYIGKKQLWSKVTKPPLKGKKRNRIEYKVSNFETYYGSSEQLKADVEKYGRENFTREVLDIVSCKWEAAYVELYYQIINGVMFKEDYYNNILNLRISTPPKNLKIAEKYKFLEKTD